MAQEPNHAKVNIEKVTFDNDICSLFVKTYKKCRDWCKKTHNLNSIILKSNFFTVKSFLKRFIDQFEVTGDL